MRLLCSARHIVGAFLALCSTLGYGSGIEIETKVYRLFEDGSFELLVLPTAGIETEANAFSPDVPLGQNASTVEAAAQMDPIIGASLEMGPLSLVPDQGGVTSVSVPLSVPVSESLLAGDRASAPEIPNEDEVAAGDRLRYELIVRNTSAFDVPAMALEIIEKIAPEVELLRAPAQPSAVWQLVSDVPTYQTEVLPSEADQEAMGPVQRLRLRNVQPLLAGMQLSVSYEVLVRGIEQQTELQDVPDISVEIR